MTLSRAVSPIVLAVGLVAGCDSATDPPSGNAVLRPGVYALRTVNGASVPTLEPGHPDTRIDSGKLTVRGDTVAYEQMTASTIFPMELILLGSYRARVSGSALTLEPLVASRTLSGVVHGDTVRLEVGHPGAPITNLYVHR